VRNRRLTGLLDFELAHVDLLASDVAQSRRGGHDGVVRGYLRNASLSDLELESLDAFWLAAVLAGVWRELARRLTIGPITEVALGSTLSQIDKIEPYRG
jgi:hypothetical protein